MIVTTMTRRAASASSLFVLLLLVAGCQDDITRVKLRVFADEGVSENARCMGITTWGAVSGREWAATPTSQDNPHVSHERIDARWPRVLDFRPVEGTVRMRATIAVFEAGPDGECEVPTDPLTGLPTSWFVAKTVVQGFLSGQTLERAITLEDECRGVTRCMDFVTANGQTCSRGSCVAIPDDIDGFEDRADGGMDAGPDAGLDADADRVDADGGDADGSDAGDVGVDTDAGERDADVGLDAGDADAADMDATDAADAADAGGDGSGSRCGDGCDDGNPCTDDICEAGRCVFPPRAGAVCPGGICCDGACVDPLSDEHCGGCGAACDDETQECVGASPEAATCECIGELEDCDGDPSRCEVDPMRDRLHCGACDERCADPTPACIAGACGACDTAADCPAMRECHSGVACADGRCEYTVAAGSCLIDGVCVASGAISDDPCRACDPTTSQTEWSIAVGAACDLGFCVEGESCNAVGACTGGTPRDCSMTDALLCTDHACDEDADRCDTEISFGCVIDDACVPAGTSAANECQECVTGDSAYRDVADMTSCMGGFGVCIAGVCAPVEDCDCNITGIGCRPNGAPSPDGCGICNSALSTSMWSPRADGTECASGHCIAGTCDPTCDCFEDGECFVSGERDLAPMDCRRCEPASSTALSPMDGGETCAGGRCSGGVCSVCDCFISGVCYASGATGGACEVCDPARSTLSWSAASDRSACGSGEFCSGGVCGSSCDCTIGGLCFADGEHNPLSFCQTCDPSMDVGDWTNAEAGSSCCPSGTACPGRCDAEGVCDGTPIM